MQKLIEGAKLIKEVVEDLNIQPCYVERTDRDSKDYPIELEVCHEGVYFYTVLTEHEYEMDFREWLTEEPEFTDEEFYTEEPPRGVTNEQWAMKQANVNVYRDHI